MDLNDLFTEFDGELLETRRRRHDPCSQRRLETAADWTTSVASVASRLANPAHLPADSAQALGFLWTRHATV